MDREAVLISMTTVVIVMFLADLFALSVYWNGDKVKVATKVGRFNETERRLTKLHGSDGSIGDDEGEDYNENDLERMEFANYFSKDLFIKPSDIKDIINFESETVKPAKTYGFQNDIPPPGAIQFTFYHYPNGHLTLLAKEQDKGQEKVNLKDQKKLTSIMLTIMNKLKLDNGGIYSPPEFTKIDSVWFARHYLESIQ